MDLTIGKHLLRHFSMARNLGTFTIAGAFTIRLRFVSRGQDKRSARRCLGNSGCEDQTLGAKILDEGLYGPFTKWTLCAWKCLVTRLCLDLGVLGARKSVWQMS
jgi:hypothetical protein